MSHNTFTNFLTGTLRRRLMISAALMYAVLMTIFIAVLVLKRQAILAEQQAGNATALAKALAASFVRNGAFCAVFAVIAGSIMAWIFGAFFTRRLKVIQSAIDSVKSGKQDAKAVLKGNDEAAVLAEGFNQMLETLRQRSREVTQLNESLEQHVTERTQQLECTNKELEAFAYSVSHDLRAPLRAIDGFSSFLEEGYAERLDEEGKRLLKVIRANAQKMDRLIIDLLTLSRTTQSELNFIKIDMRSLVEAVYKEVATEAVQQQFKFTLESMPDVWGDPVLLKQVWVNLITNAIKYTAKSPVKEIEAGGFIKNGDRVYFIKDSGAGFNPDYAGKLFGAFQRLHKADEFEGNGIGLATVQRIIHRHEGRIWADSQVDAGATFTFSLPSKSRTS